MMKSNVLLSTIGVAGLAASAGADVITLEPSKDNTLYENASGLLSSGAGTHFFAGATASGALRRAVMHFDVAGSLPAGSTINSVSLTLQVTMSIAGSVDMSLHTIDQDWGEGSSFGAGTGQGQGATPGSGDATWLHTFYPGSTWFTLGGDFNAAPSASVAVGGSVTLFSSVAMASQAQGWLDTPATNFGWLLKADSETGSLTAKRFASREAVQPTDRPLLEIDFTPPTVGTTYCNSLPNSTGSEALLTATGDPGSSLVLTSTPVPHTTGQFFYGPMALGGGSALGDGLRCVGGSTTRLLPFISAGMMMQLPNTATFTLNYGAPYASGLTGTKYFQHWFRSGLATGTGSHSSSGLAITF